MSAEIICVGTELLLGEILNANGQYLAQELAQLGIPHYYQSVVGDNIQRIHALLDIVTQRASILLFTGGLGPTPDDLTTAAIASYFQTPLIEHPELITDIAAKFTRRGRTMTANNRKQALVPAGAEVLPNPTGSAPGMIWQRKGLTIMTFPGVPSEMQRMWRDTAVPFLHQQGWGQTPIYSRMLRFRGIGEAELAEKVAPFFGLTNPMVAPYASKGEVRLRLSAQAINETEAIAVIDPVAEQIQAIAGADYLGRDDDTLASVVGALLQQRGQTLSVAESCTGGGLGEMITTIPGSSAYFRGGVMAYDNSVKITLLGVRETDLAQGGAVSQTVAQQMALGVQQTLSTDWGLGITGIAGPGGGTDTKPVGLVYLGLAGPNGLLTGYECKFGADRGRSLIRYLSACTALDQLRRHLRKEMSPVDG